MAIVRVEIKNSAGRLIYEKDFSVEGVFGQFVRIVGAYLVKLGFASAQSYYWAAITPGFNEAPDTDSYIFKDLPESEAAELTNQKWLTLVADESTPQELPMRFFHLKIRTGPPRAVLYEKAFSVSELGDLKQRILPSLTQLRLVRADEDTTVEFFIQTGSDQPGREKIHLPQEIQNIKIKVEKTPEGENLPEKPMPHCNCNLAEREPIEQLGIFMKKDCHTRLVDGIQKTAGTNREIGGVLVGEAYQNPSDERLYIEIEDFIPAEDTRASIDALLFTHQTWAKSREQMNRQFPGKRMVGWYHTHPQMKFQSEKGEEYSTRYFSTDDLTVHRQIFNKPWQAALVTDDRGGNPIFFSWIGDHVKSSGFHVIE